MNVRQPDSQVWFQTDLLVGFALPGYFAGTIYALTFNP